MRSFEAGDRATGGRSVPGAPVHPVSRAAQRSSGDPREPIVITGGRGRLGQALLRAAGPGARAWSRPDLDLDRPASVVELVTRDRPGIVIHAAAMTDVDACARQPELAMRRNGEAVAALAAACRTEGSGLVVISTNEVFSGERSDGAGYPEADEPDPRNPYGASKLAGERAALDIFGGELGLWIIRTSWLFGPPGDDFPDKVVAAADRLQPGEPLPVVADEVGCPTFTLDLAPAILQLVRRTGGGTYHLAASGRASRLEWARAVLGRLRPERPIRPIGSREFTRDSQPPRWAVLDTTLAAQVADIRLPHWAEALERELAARLDR